MFWPFKSKYDKLKREDVVDAIITLERQQTELEEEIVKRAKNIETLMEKGKKEKNRELRLFYAKKINDMKEENQADVKRGMYLLYNIKMMRRLKTAIDDNNFFASTGKTKLGDLLSDQKGLAQFLNKALKTKVKSENVLTDADEIWNEVQGAYVENEKIYGVGNEDDQLLAMFEESDEFAEENIDSSSDSELSEGEKLH